MNDLVKEGLVREMICASNLAYVVGESRDFLLTEYKVLQNQKTCGLVRCVKMKYNGKLQLYYLTGAMRPLPALLPSLDAEGFMICASGLFSCISYVRSNGFLSCRHLNLSPDRIYVNPSTKEPGLIYLPVGRGFLDDEDGAEKELGLVLSRAVRDFPALQSAGVRRLLEKLVGEDVAGGEWAGEKLAAEKTVGEELAEKKVVGRKSAEKKLVEGELTRQERVEEKAGEWKLTGEKLIRRGRVGEQTDEWKLIGEKTVGKKAAGRKLAEENAFPEAVWDGDETEMTVGGELRQALPELKLVSLDGAHPQEILISGAEFLLGSSASAVDGCISHNPAISRLHCRISRKKDGYMVTDMRSTNGTYVNRIRLTPHCPHPLREGDILRLADSDFRVMPQGVMPQRVMPQGIMPQRVAPQRVMPQGVMPQEGGDQGVQAQDYSGGYG